MKHVYTINGICAMDTKIFSILLYGITKKENAQLGLLLKYIFTNDEVFNSLPEDVLQFPDDLNKLAARYSNAV